MSVSQTSTFAAEVVIEHYAFQSRSSKNWYTIFQAQVYSQFHSTETSCRKINLEKCNSDFHSEGDHHFSSTGPLFLLLLICFSLFRMICHCNRNSFCFRIIKFKFSWDILECPWTDITCVLNPFFSNKTFFFKSSPHRSQNYPAQSFCSFCLLSFGNSSVTVDCCFAI